MTAGSRPRRPATLKLSLLGVGVSALILASCSGSSGVEVVQIDQGDTLVAESSSADWEATASESLSVDSEVVADTPATSDESSEATMFVRSSVDTTMSQTSFSVDTDLRLSLGDENLTLTALGAVDYSNVISDVTVEVDSSGNAQSFTMLADGATMWLKGTATDDAYVEGDASRLLNAGSFQPSALIGTLFMLRAATEVEVGDVSEIDGVSGREYRTSVTYDDAVAAAGADAEAFTAALSLSGAASSANLAVTVWIGDDNIIRSFYFDVEHDLVSGSGDTELRQFGEPVTPPAAPPAEETITGPEADELLDQIIS